MLSTSYNANSDSYNSRKESTNGTHNWEWNCGVSDELWVIEQYSDFTAEVYLDGGRFAQVREVGL